MADNPKKHSAPAEAAEHKPDSKRRRKKVKQPKGDSAFAFGQEKASEVCVIV